MKNFWTALNLLAIIYLIANFPNISFLIIIFIIIELDVLNHRGGKKN